VIDREHTESLELKTVSKKNEVNKRDDLKMWITRKSTLTLTTERISSQSLVH
jgi:hypothetical protein